MQGTILQDRFGRQGLQQRSRNNAAVRNTQAIAEFERGTADNDLPVSEPVQRRLIAAQDIDVRYSRNRGCADTEIDQERCATFSILSRQQRAHRGKKLPVK